MITHADQKNVKIFYQQLIAQNACNVEINIQDNDHCFKNEYNLMKVCLNFYINTVFQTA